MPVIGRGHHHGINGLVIEQRSQVGHRVCRTNLLPQPISTRRIRVAHKSNVGDLREAGGERGALAATADDANRRPLVGAGGGCSTSPGPGGPGRHGSTFLEKHSARRLGHGKSPGDGDDATSYAGIQRRSRSILARIHDVGLWARDDRLVAKRRSIAVSLVVPSRRKSHPKRPVSVGTSAVV